MEFSVPILAVTTRGLRGRVASARAALAWIAERGVAQVVVDATAADVRPRALDRAGRRELAATVKRLGQRCVGVDLLIPPEHFESSANAERAVGAVVDAIGLAADLRGFGAAADEPVVCVSMGSEPVGGVLESIGAASERDGVLVAVLGGPADAGCVAVELGPWARSGIDAASKVAEIGASLGVVRVDRFDRRTLGEVGACVGAMSVASPGSVGVADLTDSADPGRALEACVGVWGSLLGGETPPPL
ncbi:MAG: hypothetical protein AAFZ67_10805 [Planctomycetota bacterium]